MASIFSSAFRSGFAVGFRKAIDAPARDSHPIIQRMLAHYGETKDPLKAGYLTPGGKMVDLSRGQPERVLDHRDVSRILEPGTFNRTYAHHHVMQHTGAARISINPSHMIVEHSHPLTSHQQDAIRNHAFGKSLVVDSSPEDEPGNCEDSFLDGDVCNDEISNKVMARSNAHLNRVMRKAIDKRGGAQNMGMDFDAPDPAARPAIRRVGEPEPIRLRSDAPEVSKRYKWGHRRDGQESIHAARSGDDITLHHFLGNRKVRAMKL